MIQTDLLTRLRLLAEAYRLPVAAADLPREITPVSATQQVLAEVESRLADGRFRVLAAGQRFDVDLPSTTRPGERLQVTLPQAALAAAGARPAPAADVQARVSETGRFIAQLLQRDGGAARSPISLGAAQPLLPDAPLDVAATAATLRELIGLSGLFYESHQAEWVNGARDTAQLLREPQGRTAPLVARPSPEEVPGAHGRGSAAPLQAGAAAGGPAAPDARDARLMGIHPSTAPIVQQQINALETSHIVWNGQIWPGQQMRWEIEPEERGAEAPADDQRAWQTRIDLELPRLGNVSAVLNLDPAGLRVRLSAQSADTDALIAGRLAELRAALAAAGLPLAGVAKLPRGDA